jgi:hypothetical protein
LRENLPDNRTIAKPWAAFSEEYDVRSKEGKFYVFVTPLFFAESINFVPILCKPSYLYIITFNFILIRNAFVPKFVQNSTRIHTN